VTVALEAPRFLLDTNVYLDLADGLLVNRRERLLKVAVQAAPPIFWACEVTFEELMSRLRLSDQRRFVRHRKALWWMEKLTGVAGMAEDRNWIKRRGVFVNGVPHDRAHGDAMVASRQAILRAKNGRQLPRQFRSIIVSRRRTLYRSITRWVADRKKLGKQIRRWIAQQKARGVDVRRPIADMVVDAILEISRKHAAADAPTWGAIRSDADQREAQRELIAFEASYFQKEGNKQAYNYRKKRSDYSDYWLCAYCAAGYTLVTTDGRLRNSLKNAWRGDFRLVELDEALVGAESWLATRR
jgi:hypothetical protein